jgi:glutaconate CoA-transferase subunit A
MNKITSAADVVSQLENGMTIGIGGWGPRRKPMGLIREILRSDLKDLTLVSYGGADVGMLCAAGKVKKVVFAFVSLDFIPLEPYFRVARQNGDIETMEIDEGMLRLGLRAAAERVPFMPTIIGLGTDVLTYNPDIKTIVSPYADGKELVAMPALKLDASLIHVDRADIRGICQITGPDHYFDDLFARAANLTFVSCDEIVETEFFSDPKEARFVFWERSETTGVIPMAGGAHPTSCTPLYGIDVSHFKEYNGSVKEDGGWQGYVDKYINCTEAEYIEKVGGLDVIKKLPLPIY